MENRLGGGIAARQRCGVKLLMSALDTAIISTDEDGQVTSWNAGAVQILGWTEAEMFGETLDRIFTQEDREAGRLAREMKDAIELGRGGGDEGWRVRKNGARFWATGEMSPIVDGAERGTIVGFLPKFCAIERFKEPLKTMCAKSARLLKS